MLESLPRSAKVDCSGKLVGKLVVYALRFHFLICLKFWIMMGALFVLLEYSFLLETSQSLVNVTLRTS